VPHIDLPPDLPGITALLAFRPSTAKPLMELAEVLLRSDNSLTRGERELIAASRDRTGHAEAAGAARDRGQGGARRAQHERDRRRRRS
jgi:hypothetical protein